MELAAVKNYEADVSSVSFKLFTLANLRRQLGW